jgi:hypothetical protein
MSEETFGEKIVNRLERFADELASDNVSDTQKVIAQMRQYIHDGDNGYKPLWKRANILDKHAH